MISSRTVAHLLWAIGLCAALVHGAEARTNKPLLHGTHWMAITGKPLAATAGALMFQRGGNAVDAACAMIGATATMWDVLGWGGETQALVYHPGERRVIGVNALGVAPTGATPAFFEARGEAYPPSSSGSSSTGYRIRTSTSSRCGISPTRSVR
jgi:gamma-glutamyltranspeptidase/glutathione hydrolase